MGAATSSSSSTSTTTTNTTISEKTLSGVGNLIKLLPTGTVFLYQFLSPVLTNYGKCRTINKYLTAILVGLCGLSCCFSSFTDSYTYEGKTYYGIATCKGLWSSTNSGNVNLSSYKLRFGDFVHAFFAVIVFAVLVLLDSKTVNCFYPVSTSTEKTLFMVLPPVIGAISSSVFVLFPNTRHGIGYPSSSGTSTTSTTSTTGKV